MRRIPKLSLIVILGCAIHACSDQENPQIDVLEKTKMEIQQYMELNDFTSKTSSNARLNSGNVNRNEVLNGIYEILETNGFTKDKNPSDYNEILINPSESTSNGRILGWSCHHEIFHLSGNGIIRSGTSLVVWDCSDGNGNYYVSNNYWVDGALAGRNEWR